MCHSHLRTPSPNCRFAIDLLQTTRSRFHSLGRITIHSLFFTSLLGMFPQFCSSKTYFLKVYNMRVLWPGHPIPKTQNRAIRNGNRTQKNTGFLLSVVVILTLESVRTIFPISCNNSHKLSKCSGEYNPGKGVIYCQQ